MKSKSRSLIDRDREIDHFNTLLSQNEPRIWPIHGPGGVGKTWLLDHLRNEAAGNGIPTLHLDWELNRQDYPDKISAVALWKSVSVGTEHHVSSKYAFKRFQMLRSALHVDPAKHTVDYAPKSIKRLDQIVQQDLDQLIQKTDKVGAVALLPKLLSSGVKWLTIATGRAELPFFARLPSDILEKPTHLSNFSQSGIARRIKQEAAIKTFNDRVREARPAVRDETISGVNQLNAVALDMLKLTRGNPLLVNLAATLLASSLKEADPEIDSVADVWRTETRRFRASPKIGFHYYVSNRLVKRIDKNQRVGDAIWRLALPFRVWDDKKLEDILFPLPTEPPPDPQQTRPFDQLQDIGVLKPFRDQPKRLTLHFVTYTALKTVADQRVEECGGVHQQLEAYFSERREPDAQRFHQLCGKERHRFNDLGVDVGPEEYWEMTQSSLILNEEDRNRYLFDELPDDSTLKVRVQRLVQDEEILGTGGFCGDAALFLRHKFLEGVVQPANFNEPNVIRKLVVVVCFSKWKPNIGAETLKTHGR